MRNSIVWGNAVGPGAPSSGPVNFYSAGLPVPVIYSDIEVATGVWPGTGNIAADPKFQNPGAFDVRLSPASPCLNAGSSLSVHLVDDFPDLDEDTIRVGQDVPYDHRWSSFYPRVSGTPFEVDMGAYEEL